MSLSAVKTLTVKTVRVFLVTQKKVTKELAIYKINTIIIQPAA
jgi:hypothetical protein